VDAWLGERDHQWWGTINTISRQLPGWGAVLLADVVAWTVLGLDLPTSLYRRVRDLAHFTDPRREPPTTWTQIAGACPRPRERFDVDPSLHDAFRALRGAERHDFSDEDVLAVWPVRAKADLSIRRTRMRDTYTFYGLLGLPALFWTRAERLVGWDIITVINILNAAELLSTDNWDWFSQFDECGAFDAGIGHFTAVCKVITNTVKSQPTTGFPRFQVVECAGLTGYRNPPYPGFDIVRETRSLASGGTRRTWPNWRAVFQDSVSTTLRTPPAHAAKPRTLREFIVAGEWATAGASSIGKVEWEYGDEGGKFKARKNLVPDVVDLEELADLAERWTSQVNKSIVKAELGKLRIAVSSDLLTYLTMSWLMDLAGHHYLRWPGCTLEEDLTQQTLRLVTTRKALRRSYALPFDYEAFDHQPNSDETLEIWRTVPAAAKENTPTTLHGEIDRVNAHVERGFEEATLSCVDEDGHEHIFPVTGGVESGLRSTSMEGQGYNTQMSGINTQICQSLGLPGPRLQHLRGDDSSSLFGLWAEAVVYKLVYDATQAKSSEGKFGILWGETEFLRIYTDAEGCHGYASRAVPGLQQRKPWSSSPWTDEATMSSVYDTCRTLKRRLERPDRVDVFWRAAESLWARRKGVDARWLAAPVRRGGLGVVPWTDWLPAGQWPRTDTRGIRVVNQTPWRAGQIAESYAALAPISLSEASALAGLSVGQKVAADDVPSVSSALRKHATTPEAVTWFRGMPDLPVPYVLALRRTWAELSLLTDVAYSPPPGTWGAYSRLLPTWQKLTDLAGVRDGYHALPELRAYSPEFSAELTRMERRGVRRSDAIDWLMAQLPINVTSTLHPSLNGLLTLATATCCAQFLEKAQRPGVDFLLVFLTTSRYLEAALCQSDLARRTYGW